jgi:hypothetical protein
MRRLLTLMLMTALAFVSSTSVAAALCSHQDAQQHAAALASGDERVAAVAQLEDAAGALAAKKGAPVDASSFALSAFILPPSSLTLDHVAAKQPPTLGRDAAMMRGLAPQPLLEPPAV